MSITLVVAASENNVIGRDGGLPWDLPDDLRHFKEVTMGRPVIMGRKTHESIGRALPGRQNIVITRNADAEYADCEVAESLEDAIKLAGGHASIIGGGEIYKQAIELADLLEVTRVHTTIEGDTYFPEISDDEWRIVSRVEHPQDEDHAYAFTFISYNRKQ